MKRIAAAPLWFLVGWFVGSAVAFAFGLGGFLAPLTAFLLAGVVVVDPRGTIWSGGSLDRARAQQRLTLDKQRST